MSIEEWVYISIAAVESEDEILAEVRPGEPLRRATVEWCSGQTLLVRDENSQRWSLSFPTIASVWTKRRT